VILRRLRGVVLTALVWAVLWLPLGLGMGLYRYLRAPLSDLGTPERIPAFPIISETTLVWSAWGAVVGTIFALVLLGAERRHTLEELSSTRFAIWGALSAILLPLASMVWFWADDPRFTVPLIAVVILAVTAAVGTACATGMLAVARRAPTP
jgi:hypothetical protein